MLVPAAVAAVATSALSFAAATHTVAAPVATAPIGTAPVALASTLAPSAVSLASAALAASAVASTALVATTLRTTHVDDLLERGGLRSEWLRHAELTGGVRGRDESLDRPIDVDRRRHRLRNLHSLLHLSHQRPDLLQLGRDHRDL